MVFALWYISNAWSYFNYNDSNSAAPLLAINNSNKIGLQNMQMQVSNF